MSHSISANFKIFEHLDLLEFFHICISDSQLKIISVEFGILKKSFTVLDRGGQLLQSAGQMRENEILGGPDYYINSIQYLNHIFIH